MIWRELVDQHDAARERGYPKVEMELRKRVAWLAERGHCSRVYQGRLSDKTKDKRSRRTQVMIKGEQSPIGDPIPLLNLPNVEHPKLWIYALLDDHDKRLLKFTVRLDARWAADKVPFTISVELDDRTMGSGACGHPILHCHMGVDHDRRPQFRLPLPALTPWEALDWLITQLDEAHEPAPWTAPMFSRAAP
ncbi:hypothetical protein L6R46_01995 [Myxococcota bacterium]|jgi:hypothetical protein|nr:hypothetical protein [Myxococcota bacterium]